MTGVINQLIDIYARCKCTDVGEDSDYCALLDNNKRNALFDKERARIELYKKELEDRVSIQVTSRDQVREALKFLNKIIMGREIRYVTECIELIIKTYSSAWNEEQTKYFAEYSIALQSNHDYFLSFTTRNYDELNENIVNRRYKYFIKSMLGSNKYEKDKIRKNLLAESINSFLTNERLKGFFYPDREGDNRYVNEKLQEAINKSFFFIQVVQNIMFECVDPNYCFIEYTQAKKNRHGDCMHYILAEESHKALIPDHEVCLDYKLWHEEIGGRDKIILEFTERYNPTQISEFKKNLKEKLVDAIRTLKMKFYEDVPAD